MDKGFFFFQLPNTTSIQGYEGEWNLVDSIQNCDDGFIASTFDLSQIYSMSDYYEIGLSKIDEIKVDVADELHIVDKDSYIEIVKSAIEFCKLENGKVVISRVKREPLNRDLSVRLFFESLCDEYDHAFNYLCHIPGVGTWVGASPEKLLVGSTPHFEIASLAGSRSVLNKFEWSEKEIHEQNVVSSSIESVLQSLSVDFNKTETTTIQAGNVEHLFTGFRTKNCFSPLILAACLHPTPAVSGFPKAKAIEFINKKESHQRELYAGIVGLVLNDTCDLYVNLRCAKIYKGFIDLYIGGGITVDSVPSKEWEETEFKSQTLLSIIEKM